MKYLASLVFLACFFSFSAHSQNKGYLGSNFQVQLNYSPHIGLALVHELVNGTSFSTYTISNDISDKTLISGSNGIYGLTVLNSKGGAINYNVSRKGTLGLNYRNGYFFSRSYINGSFENNYIDNLIMVGLRVNSFQVKYDRYSGIAPLKRYIRYGIGIDAIKVDEDFLDRKLEGISRIKFFEKKIPFFTVGIGGNSFLTDRLYINYGVDFNLSFSIFVSGESIRYTREVTFYPYEFLYSSRFIEGQIGLGFNL